MIKQLFFTFILLTTSAFADIEFVQMEWKPTDCDKRCGEFIQRSLSTVPQVAEVIVDQPSALAKMRWKPREKFNYKPLNVAIHTVGPAIYRVRLRVRGTVGEENRRWYIESLGDNSKFYLVNPIHPNPLEYTIQYSRYNRQLSKELKEKLSKAKEEFRVVTIEGPILEVFQFPPYNMIVQSIKVWGLDDYE